MVKQFEIGGRLKRFSVVVSFVGRTETSSPNFSNKISTTYGIITKINVL